MNKIEKSIWGRKFKLDIIYDCYKGEEILETQIEAYNKFINSSAIDDCIESLNTYICKNNKDIKIVDNIFKYVIPKTIFINRSNKQEVALLCNYKFDIEHGIALVFKNNKLVEIGPQDIAL